MGTLRRQPLALNRLAAFFPLEAVVSRLVQRPLGAVASHSEEAPLATLHFPLPMSTPDHVTPAFCPNSSTCRPCTTLSISILNGFSYISFVYTFVSQPFHLIYPSSVDLIALPRGLILEMLPVHCHQNLLLAQGVERETDGETQTTLSVLTLPRIRKYLSKARFLDKVKLTAFSSAERGGTAIQNKSSLVITTAELRV